MAQENHVDGCSMQRLPLLEAHWFCSWKTHFETYIMSKDIDLWQVIQNGDFVFMMKDPETTMHIETTYEKLKDNEKIKFGKNNEDKMTLYNALLHKETIDSVFTRFNVIVTSLKSFDKDYSNKNHAQKFLRALPLRWRPKVTTIKEAKYLAELPLDELISNLKVYGMVLRNDGVIFKSTKEKVKPLDLKAKVTTGQTSNDSVCQDESDEDENEEEEFNSIVKNLWNLFKKGYRFEREKRFGNGGDRFDRGRGYRSKGVGSYRQERSCYGCGSKNHFIDDCPRAKVKKEFVGGAWSNSEDGDQIEKDATCLMTIG
ncbi:zf-CCHC domain-containing protein [Tanacetum coccineum]|uniref:Zf-CCHC domain-containing protein n=1 Tax=Tanacetum coccineum TaxID=301880 RepID=A0ABQ5ABE8_9ASTR